MIEVKRRLRRQARALYHATPAPGRWIQSLRPHICPFDVLIDHVPTGARVLDVGCGSGLFLGLLAANGKLSVGAGFDVSRAAIALGQRMLDSMPAAAARRVRLLHRDACDSWPEGTFDAVTMIDVLHHVAPRSQETVFLQAAAKVAAGGRLIYKDMARRPLWSALANRLHDLVMARQWIHYRAIADVEAWGKRLGLTVVDRCCQRLYWYTHEWLVFEKPISHSDDDMSAVASCAAPVLEFRA